MRFVTITGPETFENLEILLKEPLRFSRHKKSIVRMLKNTYLKSPETSLTGLKRQLQFGMHSMYWGPTLQLLMQAIKPRIYLSQKILHHGLNKIIQLISDVYFGILKLFS